MSRNELYHFGIKGQKWGVRRFQNPDGTLTETGKKRRRIEGVPPKGAKGLVDASRGFTNSMNTLVDSVPKKESSSPKLDLSKMSDKELQAQITRYHLEKNYNKIFSDEESINRGRENVKEILTFGGAILGVTSSALAIALAIKDLKKGD